MPQSQTALIPYTSEPQSWSRPAADARTPVTQSAWMAQAAEALRDHVMRPNGINVPRVRAAVGWTMGRNVRGQCHVGGVADGTPAIYIRPVSRDSGDAVTILDILSHEMLHAAHPTDGHRGAFGVDARTIGLDGPLTATNAGPALLSTLSWLANVMLPPLDHSVIADGPGGDERPKGPGRPAGPRDAGGHYRPQTGRMLKASCAGCGMVIRTTRRWLESTGLPDCACGAGQFTADA